MKAKLLYYSGTAAAYLLAGPNLVDAQIVYTDIDPDVFMTGDATDYILDANGDGEFELRFEHQFDVIGTFFGCYGVAIPNYSYCLLSHVYTYSFGWEFGLPLEFGNTVPFGFNAAPAALNAQYTGAGSAYGVGPWVDGEDHFLGFSFETPISEIRYYGWVRLQANDCGYYIKDFAFALGGITAGDGAVDPCDTPLGLEVTGIEAEKAKLNWDAVDGAETYTVQIRIAGETDWHEKTVAAPKNFIKLKTLSCETAYEWQVMANCAGGSSAYSEIQSFSTLSCRLADEPGNAITLFPNPANEIVTLNFEENITGEVHVQFIDITGNLVLEETTNTNSPAFDITQLPKGLYIAVVAYENTVSRLEFVKQ